MKQSMLKKIALISPALATTLIAFPAFAHPGDHSAINAHQIAEHLLTSPFHFALLSLALVAGLVLSFKAPRRAIKLLINRLKK